MVPGSMAGSCYRLLMEARIIIAARETVNKDFLETKRFHIAVIHHAVVARK